MTGGGSGVAEQRPLVHIVDSDPMTCETLALCFAMWGFEVRWSLSGPEFFNTLASPAPNIVLLNLWVRHESGVDILQRLRQMRLPTTVFMLSDSADISATVAAIKSGAADVLTKPVNTEALRLAVLGSPPSLPSPPQRGRRAALVRGLSLLTPREREVLELIARGQSNKQAGRELGISPRTVEVHRARVMEKLGARNTAELMRIVLAG